MRIKQIICAIAFIALAALFVRTFPIKKVILHDRECVVMISRIYPEVQQGDCAMTENGEVIDIKDTSDSKEYYGRIIISSTEGIL